MRTEDEEPQTPDSQPSAKPKGAVKIPSTFPSVGMGSTQPFLQLPTTCEDTTYSLRGHLTVATDKEFMAGRFMGRLPNTTRTNEGPQERKRTFSYSFP